MGEVVLPIETGRGSGSGDSRRTRRDGRVPGVVYGLGRDAQPITVDRTDLRRALTGERGTNALINLKAEGESQLSVLKDIQRHPVRREVLHVDFLRVDPNLEITVEIPVKMKGEAVKVAQRRGNVDQAMFRMRVIAKPAELPADIPVDISRLEVGRSIKVREVSLPAGVRTAERLDAPVIVGVVTRSTLELDRQEKLAAEAGDAAAKAKGARKK